MRRAHKKADTNIFRWGLWAERVSCPAGAPSIALLQSEMCRRLPKLLALVEQANEEDVKEKSGDENVKSKIRKVENCETNMAGTCMARFFSEIEIRAHEKFS